MFRQVLAAADNEALRIGLVATTFGFGLRHGIDWDHIAAITDITSSQETGRVSMVFATLYAMGHALVVLFLGVAAIALGDLLPSSADRVMERVVGVTLIILAVYVFVALVRDRREFRMRSRWMLIFSGVRAGSRWVRRRVSVGTARGRSEALEHEHEHVSGTPHHTSFESPRQAATTLRSPHRHRHLHRDPDQSDPFMNYGKGTSFLVGMIHGVGAETPTQVLIFLAAAGGGGTLSGVLLLLVFLAGLVASNSLIALASTYGFLAAGRSFKVYATVALVTGTFSMIIGVLFVFGQGTLLPAIFGG